MAIVLQGGMPSLQGGNISLQGGSGISLQPAAGASVLDNPAAKISLPSSAPKASSTPAKTATTSTPAPAPAASTAPTYENKSNDIAAQEANLANVPGEESAGVGAVQNALSQIMGEYQDTDASGATTYTNNSNENETDLQSNKESALQDAVQGRQGLYGTLASLGALNGDGLTEANNAVAQGANSDLTTAADTYAGNQSSLDSSYAAFKKAESTAESGAQQAATNDESIAKNDALKDEQTYLTNLVNDYQEEGNTTGGAKYSQQLVGLAPQIAATDVPQLSIGYTGDAYTPQTLSQYVGQANNTTVQTAPSTGTGSLSVPGLVAVNNKKSNSVT